ncbi:MAG: PEP-CTERM sorting domain-containing protein [Puniceicoccaceae bacterium]
MKTLVILLFIVSIASSVHSQIYLNLSESGPNLEISITGTLDVDSTDNSFGTNFAIQTSTDSTQQNVLNYDGTYDLYGSTTTSGTLPTMNGGLNLVSQDASMFNLTNSFGYRFTPTGGWIYIPSGTGNGDAVSESVTWGGFGYSDLGLIEGEHTVVPSNEFSIGEQTFIWSVGSISPVPEPSTYALISMGVLGVCLFLRRRMKQTT